MNNASHEQLSRVVNAEWVVAVLLTTAAIACWFRSRRAGSAFLPWLGVAYVAAMHGSFFYRDGSSDVAGFVVFGVVFGVFLGAPVGFVLMKLVRRLNNRNSMP